MEIMQEILLHPITLTIFAALLPVVLLFCYIYHQDSAKPEPASWLWKAVLYGVLSAVLVLLVSFVMPDVNALFPEYSGTAIGAVIDAFYSAAIPEEAAKLLMLWLLVRKNPYFDEHLDGIVYATCVGLGFAGLENILYLVKNSDQLAYVAVMRGIFSVPGHFFFAVAMGYFFSLTYFSSKTVLLRLMNAMLTICVPVMLHGVFDALLMVSSVNSFLFIVCMIAFLVFTNKMRKKGQARIRIMKDKDRFGG